MSVTLSKSQFRKTGYSEQGPGRRLTVGAELGFEATIEKQSPKEILMKDIGTVANGATGVSYVCKQGMQVYSCTELCSTQQYPTDTVCQVNSLDLYRKSERLNRNIPIPSLVATFRRVPEMSVTLSKSQFRKTGYSEQGPGRRLTVGAELGLSALKTLYLRLAICLLSCLLRILAFTAVFYLLFLCIEAICILLI
ncbi:hypothetical protein QL285_075443 [Trifolium repens]|nr:hypothetical protein QL285_075443 [Trifolium repens]